MEPNPVTHYGATAVRNVRRNLLPADAAQTRLTSAHGYGQRGQPNWSPTKPTYDASTGASSGRECTYQGAKSTADRYSPEKHSRPRDSTCEVIATTFLSIATQARGGNHRGRPPSQTTVSHKAALGSRDAATRNPMGLRDSKATRQPNFTGTTGRGSWNQTL
jgi:hypothetical protein